MAGMKDETKGEGVGSLLEQLRARDERIAALSRELEERSGRLAAVERRLEAERVTSDPAPTLDEFQVFWTRSGVPSEERSVRTQVRVDGSRHELLISLPADVEDELRLDPGTGPGFWEITSLSLHPLSAEREMTQPGIVADLGQVAVAETAVRLGGTESPWLRVYSHGADPQLIWKLPRRPGGASVLKVSCRAGSALAGMLDSRQGLFQDALSAYAAHASETARRLGAELEARESARRALEGQLSAQLAAEATRGGETLERLAEVREAVDRAASVTGAIDRLTLELSQRDAAARSIAADLAATRAQLATAAVAGAQLAAAKGELDRLRHEAAEARADADRSRLSARTSRDDASSAVRAAEARAVAAESAARAAEARALEQANLRRAEQASRPVAPPATPPAKPPIARLKSAIRSVIGPARSTVPAPPPPVPPEGYDDADLRAVFDEAFYRRKNSDLRDVPDVLWHYLQYGWREGRDPSPMFEAATYAAANAHARGQCPLLHYVRAGSNPELVPHCCFDPIYYLHHNADVAAAGMSPLVHFVKHGAAEGRDPHPLFDVRHYLATNPDVAATGANPLAHFLEFGGREGRSPHPLFATGWYLQRYPDVASAGLQPLEHYLRFGWTEGRDPHPYFSVDFYRRNNPDVSAAGIEPLGHFVQFGWRENRDPSPRFDVKFYVLSTPGLAESGENPLVHFLRTAPMRALAAAAPATGATGPLRLVVLSDDADGEEAMSIRAACAIAEVIRPDRYEPTDGDYVYAPDDLASGLTVSQLCNAALCVAYQRYDFVVVSSALPSGRAVSASSGANSVVLSAGAFAELRARGQLRAESNGRLVHMPPGQGGEQRSIDLDDLGLGRLVAVGVELMVAGPSAVRPTRVGRRSPGGPVVFAPSASRRAEGGVELPLVLVLPAMLAVGGVERNMVEMARALAGKYRFAIVTNEPLDGSHGSLHHQSAEVSDLIVGLAEVAPAELHLDVLRDLRDSLRPDVVWICNGSPWLSEHAERVRAIFSATPVVDQQVYDAEAGWIAHFHERAGLRSFDRYIATNKAIEKVFVGPLKLDPSRVDVIYPMIDERRFGRREVPAEARSAALAKLGLPEGEELFAQVGRLTDQKRPLGFLECARLAKEAGWAARFLLVGSGPLKSACQAFIAEHDLSNVAVIPFLEDPSELYPLLTALVISSEYEGLPIVLLEALAMGLPALSTDVGDVRRVLEEYGSGRIVSDLTEATGGRGMFEALGKFREALPEVRRAAEARADEVRHRFAGATIAELYDLCFRAARAQRGADVQVGPTDGISVIMATYNRRATLERTLRSCVKHSAGLPVELLVVDDGSRDDTPQFLERFAAAHPQVTWRRVANGGPGKARNLAVPLAKYDVALFMGDDAEPLDARFFRTHLDLHRRQRGTGTAFLGKMVWPDAAEEVVTFVMQLIQGHGGEQFGYADFRAFQELDWRFFYTCNISIKRSVISDWGNDGFRDAFRVPGFEDAELAYRLSRRPGGFRIVYAPTSVAVHHHRYSVDGFLNRQYYTGFNAKIMLDLHPDVAPMLVPEPVRDALAEPIRPGTQAPLADYAAMLEGIKAMARLLDAQYKLGSAEWHRAFVHATFEACYLQGYLAANDDPTANLARGYRAVLDRFYGRVQMAAQSEILGYAPVAGSLLPAI
jgi:glycosyltransferase involved in cell wall biosynthesis/GT2 family glycosyltransferase